jgi:hypothetical protein
MQMFEQARSEAAVDTDLIPYWIYEGSVRVERRVPMLPFSREVTRLAWFKRSLTVYRLVFGQLRRDDLAALAQARLRGRQKPLAILYFSYSIPLQSLPGPPRHSHSMVPGGFEVTS